VLNAAETRDGVAPCHLVLRDEAGVPVAAASLYRVGSLAGLYNVGTRAAHRRRGLGGAVTRAALAHAETLGVEAVFLQCAGLGPVERLYARLGFAVAARPALVCFQPDGEAAAA
jgi:predicted N-acetyltransferase YhbS